MTDQHQWTLTEFLVRLDAEHIYYRLNRDRDAVMVEVSVPGERWEVEFMDAGGVEVEIFHTGIQIEDENALDRLFERFSD
jgi:hypothetical protein